MAEGRGSKQNPFILILLIVNYMRLLLTDKLQNGNQFSANEFQLHPELDRHFVINRLRLNGRKSKSRFRWRTWEFFSMFCYRNFDSFWWWRPACTSGRKFSKRTAPISECNCGQSSIKAPNLKDKSSAIQRPTQQATDNTDARWK